MRKLRIVWIFAILMLPACITQKKCMQKYPPKESRDSVYIETIVRDTVPVPADTTHADFPVINCPDQNLFNVETEKLKLTIRILNGRLKATAIIKPQKIELVYKERYTSLRELKIPEPVKYIPKIYKDALWICIIIFAGAFVWLGLKIKKFFI